MNQFNWNELFDFCRNRNRIGRSSSTISRRCWNLGMASRRKISEPRFLIAFRQILLQNQNILVQNRIRFQVDSINSVEDTKGNNGERGHLVITNLRLIWQSTKNSTTNLSIGLNCITSVNHRVVNSRLRQGAMSLVVMTRFQNTRWKKKKLKKFPKFRYEIIKFDPNSS